MKASVKLTLITLCTIFFSGCWGTNNDINTQVNINEETSMQTVVEEINESQFNLVLNQPDGSVLILEDKPERIVVLAATTLEILHTLGIDKVVGNASLQSRQDLIGLYPDSVDVGLTQNPDMEIIATLKPDLVIAPSTFVTLQEQFEAQGHNIWFASNQTYNDTINLIYTFGVMFGIEDKANQVINNIQGEKAEIIKEVKSKDKDITAMIMFGAGDNIMFGTNQSYVGSILEFFEIKNVTDGMEFETQSGGYVPFSLEEVIILNPNIIFRIAHGDIEQTAIMFDQKFDSNPAFHGIDAYVNNRIYDLNHTLFFSNPGIRTVEGFRYIADIILS